MRTVDQDEPGPALGKPYKAPAAAPEPEKWKPVPGHPDHETNGKDIRLKQHEVSIWDLYGVPRPTP